MAERWLPSLCVTCPRLWYCLSQSGRAKIYPNTTLHLHIKLMITISFQTVVKACSNPLHDHWCHDFDVDIWRLVLWKLARQRRQCSDLVEQITVTNASSTSRFILKQITATNVTSTSRSIFKQITVTNVTSTSRFIFKQITVINVTSTSRFIFNTGWAQKRTLFVTYFGSISVYT